jgi:hypothetical protein
VLASGKEATETDICSTRKICTFLVAARFGSELESGTGCPEVVYSDLTKSFFRRRNHPQVQFPDRLLSPSLVLVLLLFLLISIVPKQEQEQEQEQAADLDLRLF